MIPMIEQWLDCMRCPSCKSTGLIKRESNLLVCDSCNWKSDISWNFINTITNGLDYDTGLAHKYNHHFKEIEKDGLEEPISYYGMTPEEEYKEFLQETLLSPEQIKSLRILDAGCGIARLTRILAEEGALCVALDIQPGLYAYAKNHKQNEISSPLYIIGTIDDIPFGNCFDVVWCQGVLSYVPNHVKAISELQRVTRSGGICYIWTLYKLPLSIKVIRALPKPLRTHVLNLLSFGVKIVDKIKCKDEKTKDKLPLIDRTIPDKITVIPFEEVLSYFDKAQWKLLWSSDEKNTVRALFKRIAT